MLCCVGEPGGESDDEPAAADSGGYSESENSRDAFSHWHDANHAPDEEL